MIEVRRSADRALSEAPGITTSHSFSAGAHYEPANTHFGLLVANDEHVLQSGAGFDTHVHRGLEIVTWVLAGTLQHEDSTGRRATVRPGMVQHLSAGSGVSHAERNGGDDELRFIQMWLLDDRRGEPAYRVEASDSLRLHKANLHVVRLVGQPITLPVAPFVHVFVARASAEVTAAGSLATGDAVRIFGCDGHRVSGDAELLILEMHADATG